VILCIDAVISDVAGLTS